MHKETILGDRHPLQWISIAIGLSLLMIVSRPGALAQQVSRSLNDQELTMSDLLKLPGKILGEGRNTNPVGPLKLMKYRVEELQLPRSMKVELHGQEVDVDKAWRVTVTGGPFPVRALPAVIWIDDQVVGVGVENERLSEITAITFDRSLLREGSTISLSYGEDKDDRVSLPEKLNLRVH